VDAHQAVEGVVAVGPVGAGGLAELGDVALESEPAASSANKRGRPDSRWNHHTVGLMAFNAHDDNRVKVVPLVAHSPSRQAHALPA
jgi:hypothetical protein